MARDRSVSRLFVVESTRASALTPNSVMQRVLDPSTWPSWQPEIISTEGPAKLGEGDVVTGRARLLGFDVQGTSLTTAAEEKEFVEDVVVGVRMRVFYRVEESEQGSLVTRRLEADMPTGFSGRILAVFLRWRLRRMQDRVLDALTGQAVV